MKYLLLFSAALIMCACSETVSNQQNTDGRELIPDHDADINPHNPQNQGQPLNVAFYNVENLFDTADDPAKEDEEWLPSSEKAWSTTRFNKKLSDLAAVLDTLFPTAEGNPHLMGFCEVENAEVVAQLAERLGNYEVVHFESPDVRGIDVALAYDPAVFTPTYQEALNVTLPNPERPFTRDILYVKGEARGKTSLHVFVNHWPSRRGGAEESEPKRMLAATTLRAKIDSIQAAEPDANILVMGDFNDYPDNASIVEGMGAQPNRTDDATELVNLSAAIDARDEGTYNYKGDWGALDQFMVSQSLFDGRNGLQPGQEEAGVYKEDWILYHDTARNEYKPSRTYGGPNYYGGFSDHLPIFLRLEVK